MQTELAAAQRRAERAEVEAMLARQLLAELRLPREREAAGGGRRRKPGSAVPAAQDDPGKDQDRVQDHGQEAPAVPGANQEDRNDSNGNDDHEN